MPRRAASGDDDRIGERRAALQIDGHDLFGLVVVERFEDAREQRGRPHTGAGAAFAGDLLEPAFWLRVFLAGQALRCLRFARRMRAPDRSSGSVHPASARSVECVDALYHGGIRPTKASRKAAGWRGWRWRSAAQRRPSRMASAGGRDARKAAGGLCARLAETLRSAWRKSAASVEPGRMMTAMGTRCGDLAPAPPAMEDRRDCRFPSARRNSRRGKRFCSALQRVDGVVRVKVRVSTSTTMMRGWRANSPRA